MKQLRYELSEIALEVLGSPRFKLLCYANLTNKPSAAGNILMLLFKHRFLKDLTVSTVIVKLD